MLWDFAPSQKEHQDLGGPQYGEQNVRVCMGKWRRWWDVVWCDVAWCNVMWCGVMRCDVMWWCDVMWCGVIWCDVMWCGVVWCWSLWRRSAGGGKEGGRDAFKTRTHTSESGGKNIKWFLLEFTPSNQNLIRLGGFIEQKGECSPANVGKHTFWRFFTQ